MVKRGYIWFGARGYEEWVPAFSRNADVTAKGFQARSDTVNGAAVIERTAYAHKEYNLNFESNYQDELEVILDHARGVYGDVLQMVDPTAAYRNVAPMDWAAPFLAIKDSPLPLIPDQRPKGVATPANTYRHPILSAQYRASRPSEKLYVPIPEGHTAWIGFKGVTTGDTALRLTPWHGAIVAPGEAFDLVPISPASSLLTNTAVTHEEASAFELDIVPTDDMITLTSLNIQILPDDQVPATGRFIGGQGHTQLKVDGDVGQIVENAVRKKMNLQLKLTEVVI